MVQEKRWEGFVQNRAPEFKLHHYRLRKVRFKGMKLNIPTGTMLPTPRGPGPQTLECNLKAPIGAL